MFDSLQSNENGSMLAYFAITLVVIIGLGALALDGSFAFVQRRTMQNAADAAALAGVRVLALNGGTAEINAQVSALAAANGADDVTWASNGGSAIETATEVTFDTGFAGIFGVPTMTASATAEASFGPVVETGNLLPMTIDCRPRTYLQTYRLWDKEKEGSGNFGWLDWNGGSRGNPELVNAILDPGNSGAWHIGDWVYGGPGVQNSSGVRNAIETWMNRHVTIPLHDAAQGNGANLQYRLCGFAEFVLTDYKFNGNDKYVEGYFIRNIDVAGVPGNGSDYGVVMLFFSR